MRQGVQHVTLDRPLERPRSIDHVEALFGQKFLRAVRQFYPDLAFSQPLEHLAHLDVHDPLQHVGVEGMEDDDLVHAVQELGPEVLPQGLHDALPHLALVVPDVLDVLASDVRGHDGHGILEVHRAPLAVGKPAVVKDLKEHAPDLGVGLLHLVKRMTE